MCLEMKGRSGDGAVAGEISGVKGGFFRTGETKACLYWDEKGQK